MTNLRSRIGRPYVVSTPALPTDTHLMYLLAMALAKILNTSINNFFLNLIMEKCVSLLSVAVKTKTKAKQ